MPSALTLMGPTAIGKTDLAVELVERLADRLPLEIISVDSALVYRGMDIGTAKPDADTLRRAPHQLIDILTPAERYSAGRFIDDARRLMAEIRARHHVPFLVGGTMLYFKALKEGLDQLPPANPVLREALEERAEVEGWPALHAELALLDPASAARINLNDAQRIERALEVCLDTGLPFSELQRGAAGQVVEDDLMEIALLPKDRAWLHERINRRFDVMLEQGFIDELRDVRARYPLTPDLPSMRSVGYRQAWAFLEGEVDFPTMVEQGKAASRQLAKRQLTWLRSWRGARIQEMPDEGAAAQLAEVILAAFAAR